MIDIIISFGDATIFNEEYYRWYFEKKKDDRTVARILCTPV